MANVFDEFEEQPKRRTTFITVLCILTFIGSGFALASNIYGYFTAEKTEMQMRKTVKILEKDTKNSGGEDQMAKEITSVMGSSFTKDNIQKNALGAIAAAILCLTGAVLMWRINKKGYIFYLAGTLMGIVIPFLLYGNNIFGIIGTVVAGFVGLVFCILYGVNLKDMK
jgi:hypothetical protein